MQHGAALDLVELGSVWVVHLLAAENKALLRWGNALLLLEPLLDLQDSRRLLNIELNL
ncbi:hypothetical protein FBU59_006795 [Linderina macrospora]|uniref:Uncharacterized protein n=1 Tax=Linderina macrospora TaxID=4868 RepID=A0ACC1IYT4_9FUNG|nr:hypothetical protein FBU59_006795 [Linderina macrospora]